MEPYDNLLTISRYNTINPLNKIFLICKQNSLYSVNISHIGKTKFIHKQGKWKILIVAFVVI